MNEQNPSETPRWVERELTHSRHVIANAKVVVTFSAALAATFASAAMDPKEKTGLDETAMWLMGFTLVLTVIVIFLRSKHRPRELDATKDPSRRTALFAYWLMVGQVLPSVATIAVAVAGKRHS
jgi:FtsH-binding integral membrane protein